MQKVRGSYNVGFMVGFMVLLLLAAGLNGLLWIAVTPPLLTVDEPQHFFYAQDISKLHRVDLKEGYVVSPEILANFDGLSLDQVRFCPEMKIQLAQLSRIRGAQCNSPAGTYVADDSEHTITQPGFRRYHPPLYYLCIAPVINMWNSGCASYIVDSCRLVSLLFGIVTMVLAYFTGKELFRRTDYALGCAVLVGFQPMCTYTYSAISNASLELLLFSWVTFIAVRMFNRGPNWKYTTGLAILLVASCLTKLSGLALLAATAALLPLSFRRHKQSFVKCMFHLLVAVSPATVALLMWYHKAFLSKGAYLVESFAPLAERHFSLWQYICERNWFHMIGRNFVGFWTDLGWCDTHFKPAVYAGLLLLLIPALLRLAYWQCRARTQPASMAEPARAATAWMGLLVTLLMAFYLCLDLGMSIAAADKFGIRGQYFVSTIVCEMALLLWGCLLWVPESKRPQLSAALSLSMIALNIAALNLMTARFYGYFSFDLINAVVASYTGASALVIDLLIGCWTLSMLGLVGVLVKQIFSPTSIAIESDDAAPVLPEAGSGRPDRRLESRL